MRTSSLLAPTLKDDPADAEVVSHKLLVRAGMIRQVARGIYDYLPLGLRVLRKVERIVREELDAAGCQEILMPVVCPAELWRESGRWDAYGKELLRFRDRNDRDFCLGPTHEEVVTDIVRRDLRSYRDLPKNLYQIQTKFRDEIRPRFGLMRGREFLMKDAYSFHATREDCEREYDHMFETYERIFRRCGLRFRAVEADTGSIGGTRSHEFQVLADSGEDAIASCDACGYAANVELAEVAPDRTRGDGAPPSEPLRRVETPGQRTVEEVSSFLGLPLERFIKTLVVVADGEPVVALVRGDHSLSEVKLRRALDARTVTLADAETVERVTGAAVGYAGPVGLPGGTAVVADRALEGIRGAATGANRDDEHLVGVEHGRDFGSGVRFADLRQARAGDRCPRCERGRFELHRGIEVGQVFYLGTKYSEALGATVLDAAGQARPIEMGCYGIGISRTMAAAVEQGHDRDGIVWPAPLAPFSALVVPISLKDAAVREAAERIHAEVEAAGLDCLLDDRDERPGVKFKDADLIGIPARIVVGAKGLARGAVEIKDRRNGATADVPLEGAVARVRELLA